MGFQSFTALSSSPSYPLSLTFLHDPEVQTEREGKYFVLLRLFVLFWDRILWIAWAGLEIGIKFRMTLNLLSAGFSGMHCHPWFM